MPPGGRLRKRWRQVLRSSSSNNTLSSRRDQSSHASLPGDVERAMRRRRQRALHEREEEMRNMLYHSVGQEKDGDYLLEKTQSEDDEDDRYRCESPNAESPPIKDEKLEEIDLDIVTNQYLNVLSGSFVLVKQVSMISASNFRISIFLSFVYGYVKFGSGAYVLAVLLSLIFIAIPFAILELAIGQYSSLAPVQLFSRISDASSAIGIFIVAYRLYINFQQVSDIRPMIILMEDLFTQNPNGMWADVIDTYFDPLCTSVNRKGLTAYLDYRPEFNTTEDFRMYYKQLIEVPEITVHASVLMDNHLTMVNIRIFLAFTLFVFAAGLICLYGMELFAKIAFGIIVIPATLSLYEVFTSAQIPRFDFDARALFQLDTYVFAISLSLQMLAVGNGSWIILGTISPYRANIIMPVLCTAAFSIMITVCTILSILPGSLSLIALVYHTLPNQMAIVRGFGYQKWSEFLNYHAIEAHPNVMLARITLLNDILTSIPYLVITTEMIIQTAYRLIPVLARLPTKVVRLCIINTFLSFYLAAHGYNKDVGVTSLTKRSLLLAQVAVLLLEIFMLAFIYGDSRIIMNMRAMASTRIFLSRTFYVYVLRVLGFFWRYVIPATLMMCFFLLFVHRQNNVSLLTVTGTTVVFVVIGCTHLLAMALKIIKYKFAGRSTREVFVTHPRWGPAIIDERRRAARFERAVRIA